jgi:hypothetical protein
MQACLASVLLVVAVFAQDIVPTWPGFHDWRYAALLVALAMPALGYIGFARKGADDAFGGRCAIALIGALLIGVAGLACGLLGPDSVTLSRVPGTVAPLPDLWVAAFFPTTDADGIRMGDAALLLRRRGAPSREIVPGTRRFFCSYVLESRLAHAAYVEARDERGGRLTITQPTGSTFLSPVLLFPSNVAIGGQTLPSDSFAVPAARRRVEVMYMSVQAVRNTRAGRGIGDHPAVLFAVDDDAGRLVPGGVAMSALGAQARVGGLVIQATAGTYPELVVSAVPSCAALWLGGGWWAAGSLWALGAARKRGCAGTASGYR